MKYSEESCIELLKAMQEKIKGENEERLPKRSDFSDEEVCAIKAFLGPWPRALEKAGLKEERKDDRKALNLEKRIRAKRRRTEAKKNKHVNA